MRRVLAVAALLTFSACTAGLERGAEAISSGITTPTASVSPGATSDATAADGGSCRAIATSQPGSLVAPKLTTAPQVDGDLSDWQTCFVRLDEHTAVKRQVNRPDDFPSGEFSLAHDGQKI
ncbi:MAG TPA: hypothetical protein VEC09_00765, partial [Actinomycetota bacterium]|nr:hypothetical protein [Actinomycetota bacterium]